MKRQIALLLILAALVLLSAGAGALSAPPHQIEAGTIAGGGYRLMTFEPLADNVAAGGAYRLVGPSAPTLHGSGCCCTYLPCALGKK